MTRLTRSLLFDEGEIAERFVRASGPAGQNGRKEATAVELRLNLAKSSLPEDLVQRLVALAGRHITTRGALIVVSRAHRSQLKNREVARARLIALLKRAATPVDSRRRTKPRRATREERLNEKHDTGAAKRLRKRPRSPGI